MPDFDFSGLNLGNLGMAGPITIDPNLDRNYVRDPKTGNINTPAGVQQWAYYDALMAERAKGANPLTGFLTKALPFFTAMLGPVLGPMLGASTGIGSTAGTAALQGISGALSGGAGGGLTGALTGGLGGGLGSLGGNFLGQQLSGLAGNLGNSAGNLIGNAGADTLGGPLLSELVVNGLGGAAGGLGGSLGSGLGGLLGSGAAGFYGGGGSNGIGGTGDLGGDQLYGTPQPGGPNTVDEVTVTAPEPMSNLQIDPAIIGSLINGLQPTNVQGPQSGTEDQQQQHPGRDFLQQVLPYLTQHPTLMPMLFGNNNSNVHVGGGLPTTGGQPAPVGQPGGGTAGGGAAKPPGGFAGVSPGRPGSMDLGGGHGGLINGGPGGSGAAAGGPGVDIQASLAPDIYPWV